jgi:pSer/pThr/pTyr-binding forkhead associated (FHA) protein
VLFRSVMFKSDGTRRDFPLTQHRTVIGRKRSCDLRIPLTSVSRQHCEIVIEDDTATIRDLGSSNGTYHNSTRVQEQKLSAGDEVVVGPVVFIVTINGLPEEIRPVRTIVDAAGASRGESSSAAAGSEVSTPSQPTTIDTQSESEPEDEEDLVVEEQQTPTVDLDDPIAALEAMANAESGQSGDTLQPPSDQDESDPDGDDFDIELLALEDDEDTDRDKDKG